MSRTIRYLTEQEQQERLERENRDNATRQYLDIVLKIDNLKRQLDSGKDVPNFPWDEYEQLQHTARLISSHYNLTGSSEGDHARDATAFLVNDNQIHVPPVLEVSSAFNLPLLASEDSILSGVSTLAEKSDFPQVEEAHQGILNNISDEESQQKAEAPTLKSLCKGKDDNQRAQYAAKIDSMWDYVKNRTQEPEHRTACAAVYKVAERLGIVYEGTKARQWKAMLFNHYKVSVSEAIGKYQIENPPTSKVFREAVVHAYAYAEMNLAPSAKRRPLPPIYQ